MRQKKQSEAKNISRRVKAVAKKEVLPQGSVTLGGRTPNIRGKTRAALEKSLEESKRKTKKDREEFRLVSRPNFPSVGYRHLVLGTR